MARSGFLEVEIDVAHDLQPYWAGDCHPYCVLTVGADKGRLQACINADHPSTTGTSLRAFLSIIPHLLYLRQWGTLVATSRSSTSAVTSGGRGWI